MVSYNGKIRVAVKAEKDFIDISKFKCCLENAFQKIFKVVYEITYAPQHVKGWHKNVPISWLPEGLN